MRSHYQVLGVDRSASADDIRRAFRRLTLQFHPDRNPGAAEQYKEISVAYEVLSDPKQRAAYDSTLTTARKPRRGVNLSAAIKLPWRVALVGGRFTVRLDLGAYGRREVELVVEPGSKVGAEWIVERQGAPGSPPGNLTITASAIIDAEGFELRGDDDVWTRRRVTLYQLYAGRTILIRTPWETVSVQLPRGEPRGLRLRGHGVRRPGRRGDLLVELQIVFPPPDSILEQHLARLQADADLEDGEEAWTW